MNNRFFTVDRRERIIQAGQLLDLIHYDDIIHPPIEVDLLYVGEPEREFQAHADFLFPLGVSDHGNQFFLGADSKSSDTSAFLEIFLEYVRRACFPDKTSRFVSFFAWPTLEQAKLFRQTHANETKSIWEIEAETYHRADMHLLRMEGSVLQLSYNAHRYWSGLSGFQEPCWEILLTPPIRAVRRID